MVRDMYVGDLIVIDKCDRISEHFGLAPSYSVVRTKTARNVLSLMATEGPASTMPAFLLLKSGMPKMDG